MMEQAISLAGPSADAIPNIIEKLRCVYDPEISVNVYDLGLIYDVKVDAEQHCSIVMSLTSAWCPSADDITREVQEAALATDGISTCSIKVTFDPQWGPHMMSDEAKIELGLFGIE